MRKFALIVAAAAIIPFGFVASSAPAIAAPAHITHVQKFMMPQTLVNGNVDPVKFNASGGYYRLAAPGTYTALSINCGDQSCSYYTVQDNSTGNYMDWEGGSGSGTIHETTNSSLARAHWTLTQCGSGFYYEYLNVYGDNWLQSNGIGVGLSLGTDGCSQNDGQWAIYNE